MFFFLSKLKNYLQTLRVTYFNCCHRFWLVKSNTKAWYFFCLWVCWHMGFSSSCETPASCSFFTSPQALARKKNNSKIQPHLHPPSTLMLHKPSWTLLASDYCQSMLFLGKKNQTHKKRWVCVLTQCWHQKNKQTKQKLNICFTSSAFQLPGPATLLEAMASTNSLPWRSRLRHGFVAQMGIFCPITFKQPVAFSNVKCLSIIWCLLFVIF